MANEERAEVGAEEFFQRFKSWGHEGNYKNNHTISRFGADLGKLIKELTDIEPSQDTLVKDRSRGGWTYKMNWAQLRAYLQKMTLYDQNAVV